MKNCIRLTRNSVNNVIFQVLVLAKQLMVLPVHLVHLVAALLHLVEPGRWLCNRGRPRGRWWWRRS